VNLIDAKLKSKIMKELAFQALSFEVAFLKMGFRSYYVSYSSGSRQLVI
jgi:hypothetical protein